MLFEDLRIAPAARPVELGDDDAAVLEKDLEDPVLVGIELDQPAVAAQADRVERVEDGIGSQAGERSAARPSSSGSGGRRSRGNRSRRC